jgi:DNA-binding transcriptional MerR regulator
MRITPGKPVTFSMNDLCEWSAATAPQVEHWVRQGIIIPFQESSGRGSHRVFSLQNVIEAAMARELTADGHLAAGLSVKQLQALFGKLREHVGKLRPELRASATFVRYVEMVDALVALTGPGPSYTKWRADVESFMQGWRETQAPLDDRILNILAGARASERAAGRKGAR